jgi:putative glutamine amidotransferase
VLERVDGLLVTGSRSNVHPARYGAAPSEKHEPFDEARDATTLPLIRAAVTMGVPMLAICRGVQELNVALGGDLVAEVHEVPGRMDHRGAASDDSDVRFGLSHEVAFEPGSRLAEVVGAPAIRVNSVHRQALGRLGAALVVEARAPDGTVEAVRVEGARAFACGVQWHPEYWAAGDAPSAAIFRAFGEAARRRMAAQPGGRLRDAAE